MSSRRPHSCFRLLAKSLSCLALMSPITGCAENLPTLSIPNAAHNASATTSPSPAAAAATQPVSPLLGGDNQIVEFRSTTVVLFESETGNDGRRIPSGSLTLPMRVKPAAANRLEIATADGPKWIARADVRTNGAP